jgi:hypothetical protein
MACSAKHAVLCAVLYAVPALALLAVPAKLAAATTERVVSDRLNGLAISGIDPLSYFTDAAPLVGRAGYELSYAGVVWQFRNIGDRAAFAAHPEVYMPRYGGYDPVGIGRGVAVPGNPLVWTMVGERLYLFYDEASRTRFLAHPDEAIMLADDNWPAVSGTLVP